MALAHTWSKCEKRARTYHGHPEGCFQVSDPCKEKKKLHIRDEFWFCDNFNNRERTLKPWINICIIYKFTILFSLVASSLLELLQPFMYHISLFASFIAPACNLLAEALKLKPFLIKPSLFYSILFNLHTNMLFYSFVIKSIGLLPT